MSGRRTGRILVALALAAASAAGAAAGELEREAAETGARFDGFRVAAAAPAVGAMTQLRAASGERADARVTSPGFSGGKNLAHLTAGVPLPAATGRTRAPERGSRLVGVAILAGPTAGLAAWGAFTGFALGGPAAAVAGGLLGAAAGLVITGVAVTVRFLVDVFKGWQKPKFAR